MKNTLREDIIELMSQTMWVKKITRKIGLTASYIPNIGIEILDDDVPLGIIYSSNAVLFKSYNNNKYYNLLKWIRVYKKTGFLANM